jgi:hypothetical protein
MHNGYEPTADAASLLHPIVSHTTCWDRHATAQLLLLLKHPPALLSLQDTTSAGVQNSTPFSTALLLCHPAAATRHCCSSRSCSSNQYRSLKTQLLQGLSSWTTQ